MTSNKLAVHALGANDEFILVSIADGSEDAKIHHQGDEETLMRLLLLVQDAIAGVAPELH